MIPEDGNYAVLKAAIEACPALPSYWQPEIIQQLEPWIRNLRWLSVTEGSVQCQRIYVAYLEGVAVQPLKAKNKVALAAQKVGGWLFDWNGSSYGESMFNCGIAMPRLLDGAHPRVEDAS